MVNISQLVKHESTKEECGSGVLDIATRDHGGDWWVAVSIYTTGKKCDTAASDEDIRCELQRAVSDEEWHKKMAFCVRMNHGGTWHADIRIQRKCSDDYGNIWIFTIQSSVSRK